MLSTYLTSVMCKVACIFFCLKKKKSHKTKVKLFQTMFMSNEFFSAIEIPKSCLLMSCASAQKAGPSHLKYLSSGSKYMIGECPFNFSVTLVRTTKVLEA